MHENGFLIEYCLYFLFVLLVRNGKINIPMLYFHRYLRLTPIFAMMVLIIASILRYLGSGPIWPSLMESEVKTCQKWWWSSMLYVQNYVNPSDLVNVQISLTKLIHLTYSIHIRFIYDFSVCHRHGIYVWICNSLLFHHLLYF